MRQSSLCKLYLGFFLPFPGTNPSSSAKGSKSERMVPPNEVRVDLRNTGDPQGRALKARPSSGLFDFPLGVAGGASSVSCGAAT